MFIIPVTNQLNLLFTSKSTNYEDSIENRFKKSHFFERMNGNLAKGFFKVLEENKKIMDIQIQVMKFGFCTDLKITSY